MIVSITPIRTESDHPIERARWGETHDPCVTPTNGGVGGVVVGEVAWCTISVEIGVVPSTEGSSDGDVPVGEDGEIGHRCLVVIIEQKEPVKVPLRIQLEKIPTLVVTVVDGANGATETDGAIPIVMGGIVGIPCEPATEGPANENRSILEDLNDVDTFETRVPFDEESPFCPIVRVDALNHRESTRIVGVVGHHRSRARPSHRTTKIRRDEIVPIIEPLDMLHEVDRRGILEPKQFVLLILIQHLTRCHGIVPVVDLFCIVGRDEGRHGRNEEDHHDPKCPLRHVGEPELEEIKCSAVIESCDSVPMAVQGRAMANPHDTWQEQNG